MLRVLLLWLSALSADSGRAVGRDQHGTLLSGVIPHGKRCGDKLTRLAAQPARQSVSLVDPSRRLSCPLFAPVSVRAALWVIAVIWMGTACILNARRCRRTHCRYTGPYYLVMIAPVLVLASGIVSTGYGGWAPIGCSHACRQQGHLVVHRAGVGDVVLVSSAPEGTACTSGGGARRELVPTVRRSVNLVKAAPVGAQGRFVSTAQPVEVKRYEARSYKPVT